jgi:class 3 adenylate cyclase
MGFDRDEIEERVEERAETVEERLDHIPSSYSMPDPGDMTIGSAKDFDLGLVFLDIYDSTGYLSRNDDIDVLFMLNNFIPEVMEIVRDYDGYFEKNTGDGILAYFGAGEDHVDIAHTILEYLATVKYTLANHINPILEEYDVEPIQIKAGAAMGDVYISRIGVNRMSRRTAVSVVANMAADLEERADKHEYLVSHHTKVDAEGCDCYPNWSQYLNDQGSHGTYRYRPSSDSDWVSAHYYNFSGAWEGTIWDNLK